MQSVVKRIISMPEPSAQQGRLRFIESLPTLALKAEALGIFAKSANAYVFLFKGVRFSGRNPFSLWRKLPPEAIKVIEATIKESLLKWGT